MRISIIGCGVVGTALIAYLKKRGHDLLLYDPPKGLKEKPDKKTDLIFISVPVNMKGPNHDFVSDESALIESLGLTHHIDAPAIIRSTILPGTVDSLNRLYREQRTEPICYMPEFLTERTAEFDFMRATTLMCSPPGANSGPKIRELFVEKIVKFVPALACEIGKYWHNYLGATKVNTSNMFYELCQKMGDENTFHKAKEVLNSSGLFTAEHLAVPGPDGKRGYGGKCFPKDVHGITNVFAKQGIFWAHDVGLELIGHNERNRRK